MTRNLFLNSAAGYLTMLLMIGIGIVTKVLLARTLSPSELGVFLSAQTIFGILAFAGSLGMTDTTARFVGINSKFDGEALGVVARGLRIISISGAFVTVVAAFLAPQLSRYVAHDPRFTKVFVILALAVPFKLVADLIGSAQQGAGRLYLKMIVVDLSPTVLFAITLAMAYSLKMRSLDLVVGAYLAPVALAALFFPGSFSLLRIVRRPSPKVTYQELLSYSLPLFLSGVVAWPLTLVPVVVAGVTSADAVSYYSLAISLASFIYLGTSVTEAAGLSVWSSYLGSGDSSRLAEDYRLSTRWGTIVGSVVFALLLLCSREIVSLLFGPKYLPVGQILPVVSCIFFINLVTGPTESILKAYGETRFILLTRMVVGGVVLCTLYPFLRWWGLYGAIAVYGSSTLVGGVGMYSWRLFARRGLHPFDRHFLTILASIGSALFLTHATMRIVPPYFGDIGAIISTVAVYSSLLSVHLFILPAMTPRDRSILGQLFNRLQMVSRTIQERREQGVA